MAIIPKIKCLAFDLGRVLFDFDYNIALDKIKNKAIIPQDKVIEELFYRDFAADFERGLITDYDFYLKFKKAFSPSLGYSEFIDAWCDIFSPKEEVIDLVRRLKAAYPVYLISNINELHFDYLKSKYSSVFSLFDGLILSYKVKSIKPENGIYEELKKVSGENYENIVYIDDREDLISQARKLNLQCIKFTGSEKLIVELNLFNVAIPKTKETSQ
ncbi:MAG: HAD family phosphatase [Candidatus Omnitrophica bacterium]|nr:HAD family phosphatase [Candidatus Omnitrophota bacterium]MBU1524504.1 HAD family phosphatase [Candidatus Omnitrophota bacterium]MBU2436314.1 HAD family phosphatase [Candidatus Omnitrophota bacterium]